MRTISSSLAHWGCNIGKKSSKETSTSTSAPPEWAVPIIQNGANGIYDTYTQNQGNLNALEGQLTGSIIPGLAGKVNDTSMLQPGTSYIGGVLGGSNMNNPANPYLSGTLNADFINSNPANSYLTAQANGSYLNSNPYVADMAHQAGQAAGNAVNSTFSLAGRTGSGNHATDLARGVDQAENAIFFQNYQNERALQNQALGMLGQNANTALGIQSQNAGLLGSNYNTATGQQIAAAGLLPNYYSSQFSGYSPLLGATQLAGQMPYYGSNSLGNIGSLLGGYGTRTTSGTKPGGWGTDLVSAGMAVLPFLI